MCAHRPLAPALRGAALLALALCGACAGPGLRDVVSGLYDLEAHGNPADRARATAPAGIELACARATWNYIVPVEGGVVLVDAGYEESGDALTRALRGRAVLAVLLTHGHLDHRSAAHRFGDTPVYVGRADVPLLEGTWAFHAFVPAVGHVALGEPPVPTHVVPVDDGVVVEVGGERFTAIALPGHTPGSVAWHVGRVLFTGDAVQCPLGDEVYPGPAPVTEDMAQAYASLRKLRDVDFDTILDGHFGRKDDAKAAVRRAIERSRGDLWAHPALRPVGCTEELTAAPAAP